MMTNLPTISEPTAELTAESTADLSQAPLSSSEGLAFARSAPILDRLLQGSLSSHELLSALKNYRLLPRLLRELIIDQAIAAVTCTPDETLEVCKNFYESNQINTDEAYRNWLTHQGLDEAQFQHWLTRDLRIKKFQQAEWGNQLNSYFLKRKTQLDRVVYSLIRTKDFSLAQELYFRIQEGEQSFASLAQQYSEGVEAQTGGLLGPVELSTPHPLLAQQLAASQPGQLLPPLNLAEWVVVVRLEKMIPAQLDEPTQQRLLNELFERWLQDQVALASAQLS